MPNQKILYAVMALNKKDTELVIEELQSQNKEKLASWLKDNKDSIYGNIADDWKPFSDKKISEIINNGDFISNTILIDQYLEDPAKLPGLLDSIEVYFIDMFSLFLKKYKDLAIRLDMALAPADRGNCCFLLYYGLDKDIQDELKNETQKAWPGVCESYKKGCLHRIAVRSDDLKNFRNYLLRISEEKDRPYFANRQILNEAFGEAKPRPAFGGM